MKVQKKAIAAFIVGSILGAGASAASADAYLGGQAGWTDTSIETGMNTGTEVSGLAATGGSISAIGGVQVDIVSGFLGLEVNVGDSSAEYETNSATEQVALTSDFSYGASAMLGTNITQSTQFYGLAGYQVTKMELTARSSAPGNVTSDIDDESFGGPKLGLGMQTDITDALAMKIQWTRTLYDSEDLLGEKVEPTESQFSIGVIGFF